MKNLTLENITKACCGTFHGDSQLLSREAAGVVIDSRKVEKDYLFVAIDGVKVMPTDLSLTPLKRGRSVSYHMKISVKQITPISWLSQRARLFLISPGCTGIPLILRLSALPEAQGRRVQRK